MSQIIEAFEKYFRCVKLNMPRVVQNCTPTPKNITYDDEHYKKSKAFKLKPKERW